MWDFPHLTLGVDSRRRRVYHRCMKTNASDIWYNIYAAILSVAIVSANMVLFGFWWGMLGSFITIHVYLWVAEEALYHIGKLRR